jgi:hypothetical protein
MLAPRWIALWGALIVITRPAEAQPATPPETVLLKESGAPKGTASRVVVEMSAQGTLRPAAPPGQPDPKPVPLKVEARFDFTERPLPGGGPTRVARRVNQAAVAINSPDRPRAGALRPEVSILIVERRDGGIVTYSPGGPLTRNELDLVQGPADPLMWAGLLPGKAVAVGETWEIDRDTARALSDYDALASSTVRAKLESLDAATASIRIGGEVRGAARGGEGTITFDGTLGYDRKAGRIRRLTLQRAEVRKPGLVEAGLDFRGTLSIERVPAEIPPELADSVLPSLARGNPNTLSLLEYEPPEGAYRLWHDRDWHTFWDDARITVLKRLDRGELLAQCNISAGPHAGKGRHQDPAQFRDDIKKALGERFVAFLGAGEIDRDGYGYKVVVQGREGDHDILWYYYLLASPEGDQALITFTLNAADAKRFGEQDAQLVGSLQWKPRPATP